MSEDKYLQRLRKIERQINYLTAHMKRIDKERKRSLKILRNALEESDSYDSFDEPIPEPEPIPPPEPEPIPEPIPEPVHQPLPEPIPEPEPVHQPLPEPILRPIPEPILRPEPVPEPEPKPEPIPEPEPHPLTQPVQKKIPIKYLKELKVTKKRQVFQEINRRFGEFVQSISEEERQSGFIMTQLRERISKYFAVSDLSNNGIAKLSSFNLYFYSKKIREGATCFRFYYLRNPYINANNS